MTTFKSTAMMFPMNWLIGRTIHILKNWAHIQKPFWKQFSRNGARSLLAIQGRF